MSLKTIIFICLCAFACTGIFGQDKINQFSSDEDTLLIRTQKVKGYGSFSFFASLVQFQDTTDLFEYTIDHPDSLSKILGIRVAVDFKSKLDYVDLIKGQIPSKDSVIILDQNNNQSFSDDEIYPLQPIDWNSSQNSIPLSFSISNGRDTLQSSSWIRIGHQNGNIFYGRDEHLTASIMIDNQPFEIGIIDRALAGSFTYGFDPEMALVTSENIKRGTIHVRNLIKKGEYLNLNEVYYKFDSINNNGDFIKLIKEKNFDDKVGIQVGMLAPDFIFKSTFGDTVNTALLHDKPLIIANSCACGGDTESPQAINDINETYQKEVHILRLDSFSKSPSNEWSINMEDEFNKDSYDKFRRTYCSRLCFVIGKNQRVLDKFIITDWEKNLPKLLNN